MVRKRSSFILTTQQVLFLLLLCSLTKENQGFFSPLPRQPTVALNRLLPEQLKVVVSSGRHGDNGESSDNKVSVGYEETEAASKGLVSLLTNVVNFVSRPFTALDHDNKKEKSILGVGDKSSSSSLSSSTLPSSASSSSFSLLLSRPTSPQELLERIRNDYEQRNYLWTGQIDLACFDVNCRFQDPTLSFVGRDTFVQNVQNLQPVLRAWQLTNPKSILLDISLHDNHDTTSGIGHDDVNAPPGSGYVQTRWNMVGQFQAWLFWKPCLDVMGRTKFWYQKRDSGYTVCFYEEEWEIPAYQALLQLLQPGGG